MENRWNIDGKVCLITGATSGIGKEAAIELAKKGAFIVFTARDLKKAEKVKKEIVKLSGNESVDFFYCDLSSFKLIKSFVEQFKEKYKNLHVLINNAGIWGIKRKLSADEIELIFAVNYLAPFLLTELLLDMLKKSAPSRIINVSSKMHEQAKMNFYDLEFKTHYDSINAYSKSKLALILFTKHLAKSLDNTSITVNALHPGLVRTQIFRELPLIVQKGILIGALPVKEGAKTIIYLATSDEVSNITGEYFETCKIRKLSDEINNIETQRMLYEVSLRHLKDYL